MFSILCFVYVCPVLSKGLLKFSFCLMYLVYLWAIISFLKSMDGYYTLLFAGFGVYFSRLLSIFEVSPCYLYWVLFVYSFFFKISVFDCSCFLVIVLSVCLPTIYTRPFLRGSHVQVLIVHGCIPQKFSLCYVECWLQDKLYRILSC